MRIENLFVFGWLVRVWFFRWFWFLWFVLARQTTSLIICESRTTAAPLLLQDLNLFLQIIDHVVLLSVHPARHGNQHEPEYVHWGILVHAERENEVGISRIRWSTTT